MDTDETGRVLVVDDREDVLTAIRLLLKDEFSVVHTTKNPATIPELLRETRYDVILLDMNFTQDASGGREGFEWLGRIVRMDPAAVVLMITAYGDVDRAVRAMKEGAADFILKPWDDERLVEAVRNGVRLRRSRRQAPPAPPAPAGAYDGFVGRSPAMLHVFETIEKVAPTDADVLILGENGTGKEVAARALHARSRRAGRPFVAADLGALPASLFESELFGYEKGAFTGAAAERTGWFEAASGGTLFLDEIGNVAPALQAKLLTALQRREVVRVGSTRPRPVDIRLVSATNQPLYELAARGAFRQDLLYRINTVEIHLPPLRERAEDVPLLAARFLDEYAARYGRALRGLHPEAVQKLQRYRWPGNVRELRHAVERAVILSGGDLLRPEDFVFSAAPAFPPEDAGADNLDLEEIERAAVRKALSKHAGNISRAADELGISRKALYRRIEKYGL